ncbi:MAG: hypothetical protein HKO65_07480 [Gemmatimonadetes bacterium]|nr:hypothetical protein [Gemmatimonadota bacterium]NNM04930.1 hypothetical protein [Gemmatimonadota bacterium]
MIRSGKKIRGLALVGLVPFLVWACDSTGPKGPMGPGNLAITLLSPNGPEGSAVLEITGGADLSFVSTTGGEVFFEHSAGSSRVIVVMDDPGEINFRVGTEDVGVIPSVDVVQVAGGEDQLRLSLSGYEVLIEGEKDASSSGQRE